MYDLKNTTALVKSILENSERCRNSDSFLYFKVVQILGAHNNVNIDEISVPLFMLNMKRLGFPPFESVRRARQKLQKRHPELTACKAVADQRSENEAMFREYAKGAV